MTNILNERGGAIRRKKRGVMTPPNTSSQIAK